MTLALKGVVPTSTQSVASTSNVDHFVNQFFSFSHGIEAQRNDNRITESLTALSRSYTIDPFKTIAGPKSGESWPSLISKKHSSGSTTSSAGDKAVKENVNPSLLVYLQSKELEARIHNVSHPISPTNTTPVSGSRTIPRSVSVGSFFMTSSSSSKSTKSNSFEESRQATLDRFIHALHLSSSQDEKESF